MDPLIRSIDDMTPANITALLTFEDRAHSTVTSVTAEPIKGNESFNAQLFRIHLGYARSEDNAPATLVAKLPTDKAHLLENAKIFQPGKKETWFYQFAAHHSPVNVPRCYYSALDPITGESILVLADLAPAQSGDYLRGASFNQAKLALVTVAGLHAAWWGKNHVEPAFGPAEDAGNAEAEERLVQQLFSSAWPRFAESLDGGVPDRATCLADCLVGNMPCIADVRGRPVKTLIHGDFRLDNMLFDDGDEPTKCWVIDWEDIRFDCNAYDVAWFIGGCVDVDHADDEYKLLSIYYQALVNGGVEGYSWTALWYDYRRAMVDAFVQGVLMATVVAPQSAYHAQLVNVIGRRFVNACVRLDLLGLWLGS